MFTGIIETLGEVAHIRPEASSITFGIRSKITQELKIDQSVAHNGICLTVVNIKNDIYEVTAIAETLKRTNLGNVGIGDLLNMERCMPANGRFDGHIVQGHIDQTAICTEIADQQGSWLFSFRYEKSEHITVEKGSITINGVSLTVVTSTDNSFQVAIIPYTWEHTNFHRLSVGSSVNLEFDIVGKYVQRLLKR